MGRPGSGKSYLRSRLAADLGIASLDIADQPGHLTDPAAAWASIRSQLTASAVIESAGTSPHERRFWRGLSTLVVACGASDIVRKERLQARPEARTEPGYVRRMLLIPQPAGMDYLWSGSDPIPGPNYDALVAHIRRFLAETREEAFVIG